MTRRRSRGFSIIEVLAAMSLFAVLASAICAVATTSMRFTTSNRHATLAAMLAQRELVVTVSWTGPEGSRDHEIETIFTSLI
jgi:prepilin-type N-terminal cleavage/methylation domain-containing protein